MKDEQGGERWTEIFRAGLNSRRVPEAPSVIDDLSIDDGLPADDYDDPKPSLRPTDESWTALKALDPIGFNIGAEGAFLALAAALIAEGAVTVPELLQEAAFELDISIATARRYLIKHTARHASLVIIRGHVQLRDRESND